MASYKFEVALSVEDYINDLEFPEDAFEDCRRDKPAAIEEAKKQIKETFNGKIPKGLKVRHVHFSEFDSSNYSHASGYHTMEVSSPNADDIKKFKKAHEA